MTPLFAATQASQPGGTQMDQSLGSGMASGALRATQQAMAFTPTQGYIIVIHVVYGKPLSLGKAFR